MNNTKRIYSIYLVRVALVAEDVVVVVALVVAPEGLTGLSSFALDLAPDPDSFSLRFSSRRNSNSVCREEDEFALDLIEANNLSILSTWSNTE